MTRRPRRSTLFPYTTLFRSGGERATPYGEWLLDAPDLLSIHGVPGDELALVIAGPALLRCVTADVRRAGDVRHLARLEVHAERSEEHTSELQSQSNLVCRLL